MTKDVVAMVKIFVGLGAIFVAGFQLIPDAGTLLGLIGSLIALVFAGLAIGAAFFVLIRSDRRRAATASNEHQNGEAPAEP